MAFVQKPVVQKTVLLICMVTMIILAVVAYVQITSDIDELNKMSITRDGIVDELGIDVVSNNTQMIDDVFFVRGMVVDVKKDLQKSVGDGKVTSQTMNNYWRSLTESDRKLSTKITSLDMEARIHRHKQLFSKFTPCHDDNVFSDNMHSSKKYAFNGYQGVGEGWWLGDYTSTKFSTLNFGKVNYSGGYVYADLLAEGCTKEIITGCRVHAKQLDFSGYMFIGANNKEGPWTMLYKFLHYDHKKINGVYFVDIPLPDNNTYFRYMGMFRDGGTDSRSLKIQELQMFVEDFFPE